MIANGVEAERSPSVFTRPHRLKPCNGGNKRDGLLDVVPRAE